MPLLIFAVLAFFFYGFVGKNQILPFIVVVWATGFVPALLTGIVLAYFKIKTLTSDDYFKTFWIGFEVTFVCWLIINIKSTFYKLNECLVSGILLVIFSHLVFALIGGISSAILAKFILPKS
ncbi:hypothetical protein [Moraxella oblonga]|uniref:hypothetical protein n=1 Tax=Moraxella oblonga TaxID=200413 RepID=UPI00082C2CFD|nr:hypothetical protein [Moraxella oblonga]